MRTLKKLQAYINRKKALLPGAVIVSIISTLTSVLPFIFIWLIIKEFINTLPNTTPLLINTYAWWAVITAILGVVFYFLALTLSHLAAFSIETNMRRKAMQKIIKLPLGFFDNNTSGRLRKIIDDNASITHTFLAHQIPDLAGTILMPVISIILILAFDWRLGLACLFPVITAMFMMGFMMGKKGRKFMESYMNSLEDMNTEAVEYVRGIPVVKVFQQTVFSFKKFYNSIHKYKDMVIAYTNMWEIPMSLYTVIIHAFTFFLVPVAIILISNTQNHANIILNLFFYILLTPVFAQSIMRSMYLNQAFGQADEAITRLEKITEVQPLSIPLNPKFVLKHDILFKNVSFNYPGAKIKAIDNISFTIPEGKTFALVGASGSGKTTIAKLVPRFWDTVEGKVFIGGVNVKEIETNELMQHISFVFQNTKLFKTSLLENITYGNPGATNYQIERAIDLSQSREIIQKLPLGLKTKIGTGGTYLSGGEQQRIVLARAILKNAPIIVLDEATAFTDPENEHLIQKALAELTRGKTVLMIAHRLTSVKNVDTILVIAKGKIIEQGTHSELLKMNKAYSGMWNEYQKSVQWTIGKEVQYV